MAHFQIQNLSFSHATAQGKPCLQNVNLQIEKGEYLVLCGASGSGKSKIATRVLSRVEGLEKPLMIASNRHEVNAIQIYDRRETELPNVGLVKFHDAETGQDLWVDTAVASVREQYASEWKQNQSRIEQLCTKTGVKRMSVRTDEDYVKALMKLFKS